MKFNRWTRLLVLALAAALTAPLLASCGKDGEDLSDSSQTESGDAEDALTVQIGEQTYPVQAVNQPVGDAGVYLYDHTFGDYAEAPDGDFTDVVTASEIVLQVGEPGTPALLPNGGFVVRFYKTELPADTAVGTKVSCAREFDDLLPGFGVRIGGVSIEIGYRNIPPTTEMTGFLFDEGWYASTTCTTPAFTEYAVQDGKVTAVNPSGAETSGSTAIPDGGFVLSVARGGLLERQLADVQVGDAVELTEDDPLYAVSRYVIAGRDRSRPSTGLVVYTKDRTPVGTGLTEVVVDENGVVTKVVTDSIGEALVPEGGFIISAAGDMIPMLARRAAEGDRVVLGGSTLYLISTPESVVSRAKTELESLREVYEQDASSLVHIDFRAADESLNALEAALEPTEDTKTRVERYRSIPQLLKDCRDAVVPSLTLQNRAAWVTVGELDPNTDTFLLHYRSEADVRHAVRYAKRVGFNTIIIDNMFGSYAAYPSKVPGVVQLDELKDFDVVQAFSDACRDEGLRFVVMVCGLASIVSTHTYPEDHYSNLMKDSFLISNHGNVEDSGKTSSLDPSREEVREFQCAIVKELAENYDLDGIQVDYIRYPLPIYYQEANYEDFGYQSPASEAFQQEHGVDPATLSISDPLWADWCAARRDVITGYARQLAETVKSVDPSLEITFTCFADYNDRQLYVYQDVEKWAEEGFTDGIYPMIYAETTESQAHYTEEISPVAENTHLMLGVGLYVKATHQSITEQLYMPYEYLADGVALFTLRYVSICGYDETVCRSFRLPAATARMGEETVKGCVAFLADRADALAYLYADEAGLPALAEALRALDSPDAEEIRAAVEGNLPSDETLRAAVEKDLAYALRFLD